MILFNKIQKKYEQNKLLFASKALVTVISIYFAIRVMFISITGLLYAEPLPDKMDLLLLGMLLSLSLSNIIELVEMFIHNKKEHFKLLFVSTLFVLSGAVFILLI